MAIRTHPISDLIGQRGPLANKSFFLGKIGSKAVEKHNAYPNTLIIFSTYGIIIMTYGDPNTP